ncbi:hypothetical protein A3742_13090 [Oleiphilus sp. HI0071]|nr:hypothetical protein A3737_24955 [Oleiphilus sp. HI0065]KZY80275.1 hypothetical protein A3742_13090 [Oleiphilus sp. HI0071]KZY93440.1 hypothetical protein A3744_01655 [Oleiphilus sp. HI0073]KZZ14763.1 hypothetical protein A3750_13545 [Oleiphilus sp. HI0079]KZZ16957.1 hypothetical protein A3751_13165 [Oleiphilus sp. HI0080]KZZ43094.1 hypothetical protein A3758_20500 [Oleiphilus sp. HI0118]KZZ58956.1 hypothetical protein A3760_06950 [Oleiphilus sp. HI0122]KZZ72737.1 hypothetical protein A37
MSTPPSLPHAKPEKITEKRFRDKLKHAVKSAGQETIEKAFVLYYTMRDPATPTWCKSVIAGALAYFISFIDGIPDLTPVLGYTDDLTVMIAAISVIATHISDENKRKAKEKAENLFS